MRSVSEPARISTSAAMTCHRPPTSCGRRCKRESVSTKARRPARIRGRELLRGRCVSRRSDARLLLQTPLGLSQGFNGFCANCRDRIVAQKPLNPRHKAGGVSAERRTSRSTYVGSMRDASTTRETTHRLYRLAKTCLRLRHAYQRPRLESGRLLIRHRPPFRNERQNRALALFSPKPQDR